MTKWILLAFCYSFLLLIGIVNTSESRAVYVGTPNNNKVEKNVEKNVQKGNIFTVPLVLNCGPGEFIDHGKKCRKVIDDDWF